MVELISPQKFTKCVDILRNFFMKRNFLEVHTQNRLSILAACEDPTTIATFEYAGSVWPLPQTGQMWLEYELLKNPYLPGVFCVSTSFRQEPDPVPGRHDLIFPMFEFELQGDLNKLIEIEKDLCLTLGFEIQCDDYPIFNYMDVCEEFGVKEITATEEQMIFEEYGKVVFIKNFPIYTSPFWNMKKIGDVAKKVDAIIYGIETFGSSERSTNPKEMGEQFHTISNGLYADTLFARFGRDRVEAELSEFLSLQFFQRSGGGIGITRLLRNLDREQYCRKCAIDSNVIY